MEVASRHHLRRDAVRTLEDAIDDHFGVTLAADRYELVELSGVDINLVLVDGEPLACYLGEEPTLTVRGANAHPPTKGVVTVDAGAVSFVSNGADVMRPGIVEADPSIEADDLVVIVEETHGKALAIGRARVAGSELLGESGKVVDSLHHVGDELYGLNP